MTPKGSDDLGRKSVAPHQRAIAVRCPRIHIGDLKSVDLNDPEGVG